MHNFFWGPYRGWQARRIPERERVIQCQKLWEEDQRNSVPIFGVGACRSANLDFANLNVPRIQQLMVEMSENSLLHETMAAEHEILKKCQDCKNNTISCSQANWCDVGWRKSNVFIQGSRTCCRKAMLPVHPFKKTLPLDLQCSTAKEGEVQSAGSPQENESAATNHERETQLSIVHLSKRKSRLILDGSFHFHRGDCGFFLFASQLVDTAWWCGGITEPRVGHICIHSHQFGLVYSLQGSSCTQCGMPILPIGSCLDS